MIALTGATGHLGNVVVRELQSYKEKIRALVLPGEDTRVLQGLDVEYIYGDVRDPEAVHQLCKGARWVFHMASMISISRDQYQLLRDINVGGTRNIIQACQKNRVQRLVYTSSVHAFSPLSDRAVMNEESLIDPATALGDYGKTKAAATRAVFKAAAQGLDAVVLHPAAIIGPYDYRPSKLGRWILQAARGRMKIDLEGAYSFVDVRDVARAEILAAVNGVAGHNYILSGERRTLGDFFQMVAHTLGRKIRQFPLPQWFLRFPALVAELYFKLSHTEPIFTREALDILRTNTYMTARRAQKELGFMARPLQDTLEDELAWFQAEGVL